MTARRQDFQLGTEFLLTSNFLRRFYLPLLLCLCAAYALRPIGPGYDFWAHAAIGHWIWNHKAVPESSLFLWGSDPIPWVAHSWLSQLFFYGLVQMGGGWTPRGNVSVGTGPMVVVLTTTLVACAVWARLWRLWRRRSWSFERFRRGQSVPISFVTPIVFAMAIWVGAPRYQPRQEMLTALLLALLLSYLVERHPPDNRVEAVQEVAPVDEALLPSTENTSTENAAAASGEFGTHSPQFGTHSPQFGTHSPQSSTRLASTANVTAINATAIEDAPLTVAATRATEASTASAAPQRWFGAKELALIAMFALWVNLHALVLLGLIFLFVTALCDAVQDRLDGRSRALLLLAVLCACATLVNPFGFHFLEAAVQLKPGNMANNIDEWKPPWQALNLHGYVFTEMTLAALALLAWAWNPKRRWAHALWVVIMMILFLKQRRHLWLAAIVFVAVAAANAGFFDSRRWWAAWKRLMREPAAATQPIPLAMRRIAQGGILASLLICLFQAKPPEWSPTFVSRLVPEGAAYALEQGQKNGTLARGNLFNDYSNSSYLQWRLNRANAQGIVPTRGLNPLYIDLINAYPDGPHGLLMEYFVFLQGNADADNANKNPGLNLLDNRGVNTVYLPRNLDKKWLAQHMNEDKAQWRRVYQGDDGTLWARRKFLPVKPLS